MPIPKIGKRRSLADFRKSDGKYAHAAGGGGAAAASTMGPYGGHPDRDHGRHRGAGRYEIGESPYFEFDLGHGT